MNKQKIDYSINKSEIYSWVVTFSILYFILYYLKVKNKTVSDKKKTQ